MKNTIKKLQLQTKEANAYLLQCPTEELLFRRAAGKWSKKEILGHLIDSAIYNLQRFTEIQVMEQPYVYRRYLQNELVIANNYQDADLQDLLNVWLSLNKRIEHMMAIQTEQTLAYEIVMEDEERISLHFLMTDYVDHMAHHLKAIL